MSFRIITKLGRTLIILLYDTSCCLLTFLLIAILLGVVMPCAVACMAVLVVKNNDRDEHPSLFSPTVSDEEKSFYDTDTRGQCYKTFVVRDLWIFIIR
jgi:hypothetical protein